MRQQKSLTLILARGFAANLSMPISVHDPTGRVVFYNEPAEAVFGVRFAETGELSAAEWTARFLPEEADGTPIPLEALPVGVALTQRRPAHRTVHFTRPDSVALRSGGDRLPVDGTRGRAVRSSANLLGRGGGLVPAPHRDCGPRRPHGTGPARRRRPKGLVLLLAREFAANLATPIYIADGDGTLVYFNEAAERIGGRSFTEAGEMSIRQWAELLRPRSVDGSPAPA